ncbi:ParA family protein [Brachybacterium epidermidis]|uniref:ParA family protein n=1 Tax=Brachybacterium epidermidis TaxID=2781983 RepID=UPI00398EF3F8
MKVVMTNTKGGVGKTTSTIYLACALAKHVWVEVCDADPQGSATEWAQRATDAGDPLPFEVRSANMAQLRRLDSEAEVVLIDTPPGNPQLIDAALRAADIAIIPSAPSALDMSRVWETETVASSHVPTYVLLTQVDTRARGGAAAMSVLDEQGVGHFETAIGMREAIRQSFGLNPGNDLYRYEDAARELLEVLR